LELLAKNWLFKNFKNKSGELGDHNQSFPGQRKAKKLPPKNTHCWFYSI
jgi:hypothetical protein